MKALTLLLLCFPFYKVNCQDANVFLAQYNKNIDPNNSISKVSTMIHICQYKVRDLKSLKEYEYTMKTIYSKDGLKYEILKNTGEGQPSEDGNLIPQQVRENKRYIEYGLNIIFADNKSSFTFESKNDSMTMIKEALNSTTTKYYTFHNNTKYLVLQSKKSKALDVEYSSTTKFSSFRRFDGILLPTEVEIVSSIFSATIDLISVEFK